MSKTSLNAFKSDPDIRELCSVRGIKHVEFWNLNGGREESWQAIL